MKVLRRIIIAIFVVVLLVAGALVGGYFYVRSSYGIDLIKTAKELKVLSQTVDEKQLCTNAFTTEDMKSAQSEINNSVEDYVTFTEQGGYYINFTDLSSEMKYVIKLTDKQVGALAQTVVKQEMNGEIEVGGQKVKGEIVQIDFSDVKDGGALFNTIIKIDLASIKEQMSSFPLSIVQKLVPDNFYVSSTVKVAKGEPFAFFVEHDSLTINNLSSEETEDLLNTLNIILKFGTAKDFNEIIGNKVVGSLIGSSSQRGLAYSLKSIGATDYKFLVENGTEYFAVIR